STLFPYTTLFRSRTVSTIYTSANSYYVILQDSDMGHQDESDLSKIYLRNKQGGLVQLLSVATVKRTAGPIAVNHQGQLQAVTLSFDLAPGVSLGGATATIDRIKSEIALPQSIMTNYAGDAAVF